MISARCVLVVGLFAVVTQVHAFDWGEGQINDDPGPGEGRPTTQFPVDVKDAAHDLVQQRASARSNFSIMSTTS
jgi:hypothetical protein